MSFIVIGLYWLKELNEGREHDFLFSLCGSWNALTIISWCIDYCCLLSLRIHGVRKLIARKRIHVLMFSLVAGFYAGRIYKTIKGSNWKRTAVLVCGRPLVSIDQEDFSVSIGSDVVSSSCLYCGIFSEFLHLGKTFIGRCSIFNNDCYSSYVVRYLISISLPWILLWLS